MSMPDLQFVTGLQANLHYWRAKTAVLTDTTIRQLNPDFPNLLRAVEMGLVLPETQRETADLILQCFFWVEQMGYVPIWQPVVELAVQRLPETETRHHFRLLKQLGQLQRLQRQLDTAVATFQQAEHLAQSHQDEQAVAEIHMNLCQVYHLKGMYKEAEGYGRAALACFTESQLPFKAMTLRTFGIMAQEQGHLAQAAEYLYESQKLAASSKERALTLNALAIVLQHQNQYDQALLTYDDSLALLDSTTNTNLFVEVQLNKGSLLYSSGQFETAEILFREVEQLLQQRPGFLFHRGLAANNLGCILREREQFEAAEACFHRSIRQFAQVGADIYQANAWGNLAKLYVRRRKRTKAITCYDQALQLVAPYANNSFANELHISYTDLRNEL